MMEAARLRHRDDTAHRWRLDLTSHRRVAPERHMGTVRIVIRHVLAEDPTQVVRVERDHVVDDLSARGAHPSFGEPVLPWGPSRDSDLRQTEVVDAAVERGAEDLVAVAYQSCKPDVGADRLDDLLRRPFGRRVLGDVHVDHSAAFEREHEEHVQNAERHGRHREEVDRNRADGVGANERPPRLRRRPQRAPRRTRHVPRDRVFAHVVTELREFVRDPAVSRNPSRPILARFPGKPQA
jgi:hypothetical protein